MLKARTIIFFIATAAALSACSEGQQDMQTPISGKPNPAAVYCEEQGGSYNLETGECTLKDGSVVDAWQYYRDHHKG
jgi:putative hemolysin